MWLTYNRRVECFSRIYYNRITRFDYKIVDLYNNPVKSETFGFRVYEDLNFDLI